MRKLRQEGKGKVDKTDNWTDKRQMKEFIRFTPISLSTNLSPFIANIFCLYKWSAEAIQDICVPPCVLIYHPGRSRKEEVYLYLSILVYTSSQLQHTMGVFMYCDSIYPQRIQNTMFDNDNVVCVFMNSGIISLNIAEYSIY